MEHVRRQLDVGDARDPHRLAVVDRLDLGQLVRVLEDDVADPPDDPPAVRRGHPAPLGVLECPAGRGNREVDVFGVATGDVRDDLAKRRVENLKRAAVAGFDPVTVDEHPLRLLEEPGCR